MAHYKHLPVYKKSYDLLLRIAQVTKEFAKDYKYTLGEKLNDNAIELVIYVYKANSVANAEKKNYIQKMIETVQLIELLLKMAHDLRILPKEKYPQIIEMTDEIARQLSGWHSFVSNEKEKEGKKPESDLGKLNQSVLFHLDGDGCIKTT